MYERQGSDYGVWVPTVSRDRDLSRFRGLVDQVNTYEMNSRENIPAVEVILLYYWYLM